MDWIHLPQKRNQWQALVNVVMNLWVLLHGVKILERIQEDRSF
jgi:hypothetical protein